MNAWRRISELHGNNICNSCKLFSAPESPHFSSGGHKTTESIGWMWKIIFWGMYQPLQLRSHFVGCRVGELVLTWTRQQRNLIFLFQQKLQNRTLDHLLIHRLFIYLFIQCLSSISFLFLWLFAAVANGHEMRSPSSIMHVSLCGDDFNLFSTHLVTVCRRVFLLGRQKLIVSLHRQSNCNSTRKPSSWMKNGRRCGRE